MTDVNSKLQALCDDAWQAVLNTTEYREFQILNNVVKQFSDTAPRQATAASNFPISGKSTGLTKRITQVDVAAHVLHASHEPRTINDWLARCLEHGIGIKGDDPLPNFRATVSRSSRFYNFRHDRTYYWWLQGVDLPEKWKNAIEPDLLNQSIASAHTHQGGGEADANIT